MIKLAHACQKIGQRSNNIHEVWQLTIKRKNSCVGLPPKANLFYYELILINSIILELWKFIHLYIYKRKKRKKYLKIK